MAEEHVLVVETQELAKIGLFHGFRTDVASYLPLLHDPAKLRFLPRSAMEQDPSYKQLIPYVVLVWTDAQGEPSVFVYTRGSGQGEKRLHRKRSLGIGGHISLEDETAVAGDLYERGMQRELAEEVIIESPYRGGCVGLINDDASEVGRVHLGIVHRFDLTEPQVRPRETDLLEAGFIPVAEAKKMAEEFETWSKFCLENLFPS